jgi:serine/threonine protein kinase
MYGYVVGLLPKEASQAVAEHVEECPSCEALVRTLKSRPDTSISMPRQPDPVEPVQAETGGQEAVERIVPLSYGSWPTLSNADTPMPPACTDPFDFLLPPQQPNEIGRLGHYRILRKLGAGGMGIVFLAEDIHLKRQVALKVLQPEAATDREAHQRFLREAQAAANLEHENIVTIFQVGEERGVPYLAMQLLKGMSLEDRLRQAEHAKPPALLSSAEILCLGRQIARGLAAAHEHGLVHRDIKPGNIFLVSGGVVSGASDHSPLTTHHSPLHHSATVKILDFGLARPVRDDAHLTQSGSVVGTPAYMAPEQARGRVVDGRCDLFSLGVVLYRMCTGQMPFTGHGTMAVLTSLAVDDPKPVSELNPAAPQELAELVMQLLNKDPARRPASAQAVAGRLADLEAWQTAPVRAKPVPLAVPVKRAVAPNPWADIDVTEPALPRSALPPPGSGRSKPLPVGHGSGRRRRLFIAVAVALLGIGAGLLFQQVIIRDKDGKRIAEIELPKDGKVSVVKDGKEVPLVPNEKGASKSELRPKGSGSANADRKVAEWVLSIGGKVAIRQAGNIRGIEETKNLPSGDLSLVGVAFHNTKQLNDAGLAKLKLLLNIERINLDSTPITDAGLVHLEALTNLTELNLSSNFITDAGLVHLKNLTNLTSLQLYGISMSDRGLVHVKGLTNLTTLGLLGVPITDAGLTHLKTLTKLTGLSLEGTRVTDNGLTALQSLTELRGLRLDSTGVTDAGLTHLQKLSKLETLYLPGTQVSDAGLVHLQKLPHLNSLILNRTRVTDAGLAQLQGLPQLTTLQLMHTKVSDAGLEYLQKLPNLSDIELEDTHVTDAGLAKLKSLTNLRGLGLSETKVTDNGLVQLKPLVNLLVLQLSSTRVSDAGVVHLKNLPHLSQVMLDHTRVSDAALADLVALPRSITQLRLMDTRLSGKGFATLKAAYPNATIYWSEPNHETAKAVVAMGGAVDIQRKSDPKPWRVATATPDTSWPEEYFQVTRIILNDAKKYAPERMAALTPLHPLNDPEFDKLEALDLSGLQLNNLGLLQPLSLLKELVIKQASINCKVPSLKELKNLRLLDLDGSTLPSDVDFLSDLTGLTDLNLARTQFKDDDLAKLKPLTKLHGLVLDGNPILGHGLSNLKELSSLKDLQLGCPTLNDQFSKGLGELKNLERLSLAGSGLTDEGLKPLHALSGLKELDLTGTQVTAEGMAALRKALSQCKIVK